MKITAKRYLTAAALFSLLIFTTSTAKANELSSWNDGPAKKSIVDFVKRVTTRGSKDFVPEPERIAVFDNDGTLWAEQPMYFQILFARDRVMTSRRSILSGRQRNAATLLRIMVNTFNLRNPNLDLSCQY